jgi:hypothetical protein
MGNHSTEVRVHAVPRVGDRISCAFASSGIPTVHLVVTRVLHREQQPDEPLAVIVTTDGDPEMQEHNDRIFEKLTRGAGIMTRSKPQKPKGVRALLKQQRQRGTRSRRGGGGGG